MIQLIIHMPLNDLQLPSSFIKNIQSVYGESGNQWIHNLPEIIAICLEKWEIDHLKTVENLSHSYISHVQSKHGAKMILKLAYPDEPESLTEIEALKLYDGRSAVKLLAYDKIKGALLLESIYPGKSLRSLDDELEATRIASSLMRELLFDEPVAHTFPCFYDWAKVLDSVQPYLAPAYRHVYEFSGRLLKALDNKQVKMKLLHGDMHHDNILYDHKRGWLIIDPKGVIGPIAYQPARYLRNFWGKPQSTSIFRQRVEIIAQELNESPYDIAAYAYLDFVIGYSWMLEGSPHHPLDLNIEQMIRSVILAY